MVVGINWDNSLIFSLIFPVAFASDMRNGTLKAVCDSGWVDGHFVELGCFKFGAQSMSISEANSYCFGEKGYLLEILTLPQMDYLQQYLELLETVRDNWFCTLVLCDNWFCTHALYVLKGGWGARLLDRGHRLQQGGSVVLVQVRESQFCGFVHL